MLKLKNLKKVVVKIKIIFVLLYLCTTCLGQVDGKYLANDSEDYIIFNNGSFEYFEQRQLQNAIGMGSYKMKNSKLILNFKEFELPKQSYFEVKKEKRRYDDIRNSIRLDIFEGSERVPFSFSPVVHLKKSDKVLLTLFTNSSGQVKYLNYGKLGVDTIELRLLGYEVLSIGFNDYRGYDLVFECHLFPTSYTKIAKGKSVIPINIENGKIILFKNGAKRIYTKQN